MKYKHSEQSICSPRMRPGNVMSAGGSVKCSSGVLFCVLSSADGTNMNLSSNKIWGVRCFPLESCTETKYNLIFSPIFAQGEQYAHEVAALQYVMGLDSHSQGGHLAAPQYFCNSNTVICPEYCI